MPRRFRALLTKELRELLAARSFWLLLLMIGPLVGHAFITAVETYAEATGIAGGPAALSQGLSPLDGILVPTFGAYDLAVTLLFPFVAIRLVAAEKASGAWKLLLQSPASATQMLAAKGLTLLAGWLLAWLPGLAALSSGNSTAVRSTRPRSLNLLTGHLLRVVLAAGIAVAAGAIANGAASAAIATLGFTVGTWALEFIAAGRGGTLQKLASYTPTAALRVFEQGEFRLSAVLVTLAIGIAGFALAANWLHPGRTLRARCLAACVTLAGLRPQRRRRLPPPHLLGPQRESPQLLLLRRRAHPRPHPPTPPCHRLPRPRRPAPDGPRPQHPLQTRRASSPKSKSSTPPTPAPDSSKPPATTMAKSGTNSAAANQ